MRKLLVIGIGAGDPEHVTAQAVRALNEVDVFFVVEKGDEKHDLVDLRREICERYIERPSYRTVEMRDPERDRTSPAYGEAVAAWRHARAELYEATMRASCGPDECGAFLVWGDPALYDSTLAIVEEILARGELEFEYEVVPGISSVQALAARHRVALNRVGRPITITTGRRLLARACTTTPTTSSSCSTRAARSGASPTSRSTSTGARTSARRTRSSSRARVAEVADEIERVRAEARARKGWIMDTYLLRGVNIAGFKSRRGRPPNAPPL